MNKSFYILIFIFYSSLVGVAQENLVPNSSFEEMDSCNAFFYFLENGLDGWISPTEGTSDIFNGCTTDEPNSDVPNNYMGWQHPRTGLGYAGLSPYETVLSNPEIVDSREYIQIKLKMPLLGNRKYRATFYVSLADYSSTCGSNFLGMYFSGDSIYSAIPWGLLNYPAQVESNEVIQDSVSWTKIEGIFEAEGGEEYLTIGCFRPDSQLEIICNPLAVDWRVSYYYIDDVCVDLLAIEYFSNIPNIFTPNKDDYNEYFQLQFSGYVGADVKIYNRWGNLVFTSDDINFQWDGQDDSEGTYYYTIKLLKEDNLYDLKKGYVQLIR